MGQASGECAALEARGVTDGRALMHIAYSEEDAREWTLGAKSEYRNSNMPSPAYSVFPMRATARQSAANASEKEGA